MLKLTVACKAWTLTNFAESCNGISKALPSDVRPYPNQKWPNLVQVFFALVLPFMVLWTTTTTLAGEEPYPDKSNTGVPASTVLTRYEGTLHITTDNQVVEGLEVIGNVVIEASNVTVKNSRIISGTPWHAVMIVDNAPGFTLMDCEIDGQSTTDNGFYGHGTILRSNIHGVENGMTIWGPSVIKDNFIHSLAATDEDPHFDGIQINGANDVSIVHNTVINEHEQTAAIIMGNTFSGLSNIVVDNNLLIGGGYTLYVDGRKGGGTVDDASIRITDNRIGGGRWGSFALYDQKPILSGNVLIKPPLPSAQDSPMRPRAEAISPYLNALR